MKRAIFGLFSGLLNIIQVVLSRAAMVARKFSVRDTLDCSVFRTPAESTNCQLPCKGLDFVVIMKYIVLFI